MAYVYIHRRKDNNIVFYVGIGSDKDYKRAHSTFRDNVWWQRIANKIGFNVEIIEDNLTWQEACEAETKWISFYGRKDLKKGTLVNLTDGGDGSKGRIPTELHKKRQSDSMKETLRLRSLNPEYIEKKRIADIIRKEKKLKNKQELESKKLAKKKLNELKELRRKVRRYLGITQEETRLKLVAANVGRVVSEETKKKLSDRMKGNKLGSISSGMKGKKHSEESRLKMSNKSKGQIPWNKGLKVSIGLLEESKKKRSESIKKFHENRKKEENFKDRYKYSDFLLSIPEVFNINEMIQKASNENIKIGTFRNYINNKSLFKRIKKLTFQRLY